MGEKDNKAEELEDGAQEAWLILSFGLLSLMGETQEEGVDSDPLNPP